MRVARRALFAAVLLVALGACSGGSDDAAPSATVGTEPATTTTTDPYAIPAVIDEAYVNRVLAGLEMALSDVDRLIVQNRSIPQEAIDRLRALYADAQLLQLRLDVMQDELRTGLSGYQANPGVGKTTVVSLITATKECLYAQVDRDYSDVAVNPDPRYRTQWIALEPLTRSNDARGYNPTGWAFTYEGFERDLSAPRINPCSDD